MKPIVVTLCALALLPVARQQPQVFTGVITDDMCPTGTHTHMRMGPSDAECTRACIMAHGGAYVLYDGTRAYVLSDQMAPEKFAAQKVRVTGTLDDKTQTIRVESIAAVR